MLFFQWRMIFCAVVFGAAVAALAWQFGVRGDNLYVTVLSAIVAGYIVGIVWHIRHLRSGIGYGSSGSLDYRASDAEQLRQRLGKTPLHSKVLDDALSQLEPRAITEDMTDDQKIRAQWGLPDDGLTPDDRRAETVQRVTERESLKNAEGQRERRSRNFKLYGLIVVFGLAWATWLVLGGQ